MEPQPQKEDEVQYREPGVKQTRVLRGIADTSDPKWVIVRRRDGTYHFPRERVISIRRGSRPDGATT